MANVTSYIYAGAAHWTSAGDTMNPGGLFRRAVGDDHWQALTNGMPESSEVRAIAVHPQNPQVVYAGTQRGRIVVRTAVTTGRSLAFRTLA